MVYILLADGFEEAEAIVPADLLRRAGVEVALTGVTGPVVTGAHGIAVQCDLELEQVDQDALELLMLQLCRNGAGQKRGGFWPLRGGHLRCALAAGHAGPFERTQGRVLPWHGGDHGGR